MFIRTKKTPNSPKTAVQLVEAVREGKTIRQKLIRHFGYALNEEEIAGLKALAIRYKLDLEEKNLPTLFAKPALLALIEAGQAQGETDTSPLPVNLRDIREEKRVCLGIHQAYGRLFDRIGFGGVIKNPRKKKAAVSLLRHIVMARIANPLSKRGSVQMLEQQYGIRLDIHAVYRMMDLLDDAAIDKTRQITYQYTCSLLDEKVNIIFYDCTTLYFESFIEDDLKQNGYSKDGKFNQSQVLLAIMVTQAGLPAGYELFEGSRFEGNTLDNALDRLHQHYKIDKLIFVADAALLSKDNIRKFKQHDQPFIVGARIKNMSQPLIGEILDTASYGPLYDNLDGGDQITFKDIAIPEQDVRLIVTYSPRRAAKDKHDREKAIESLSKRIAKSDNPTSLLSNFGYKKFVRLQGDAKLVTDEKKIAEAARWDGLHGLITNLKTDTARQLVDHYKGLWQVEETFRLSKHDLRMRPVFHWTPHRIKAHIGICFMALMCIRVMEYTVRLQYRKLSPAVIKNVLMRLEMSILMDNKTARQYALPSKATQEAKKIFQILGLTWKDTPYLLKSQSRPKPPPKL